MNKEQEYQSETSSDVAGSSQAQRVTSQRGEQQHHDQQTDRMALTDADTRHQPAAETPQATRAGQESPFLNALVNSRVLAAAAVELYRQSTQVLEEREVYAEEYYRQKKRESTAKSRQKRYEQDPHAYEADKEAAKLRMRELRVRRKQEAESQQPQAPPQAKRH